MKTNILQQNFGTHSRKTIKVIEVIPKVASNNQGLAMMIQLLISTINYPNFRYSVGLNLVLGKSNDFYLIYLYHQFSKLLSLFSI